MRRNRTEQVHAFATISANRVEKIFQSLLTPPRKKKPEPYFEEPLPITEQSLPPDAA